MYSICHIMEEHMAKAKTKNASNENYLKEVRNQYENYPYPPRDPAKEKETLYCSLSSALDAINYYNYSGKKDFSKGFNVLIAGSGTGDGTIFFAEQLRNTDTEIVSLDISKASIAIAKERAKVRGLKNIKWVHGSLLDAQKILNKKFDFINCIGVLHHLASPENGLSALTSVLKDDGVIEIMLYAKYGREAIYQIQSLMKLLNKNELNMHKKVQNCKTVLTKLPPTNGFNAIRNLFTELKYYDDVGIYDLLLHSNDIAFSVPEVYQFVERQKLKLSHFFFEPIFNHGNNIYKLESYLTDTKLLPIIQSLSEQEKQTAAELINGRIFKHVFYTSKNIVPPPTTKEITNIPSLSLILNRPSAAIPGVLKQCNVGQEIIMNAHNMEVRFVKTTNTELIFKYLDGNNTIGDIFRKIRAEYKNAATRPTNESLKEEFDNIYNALRLQDWIFLRDKSVPKYRTLDDMQSIFQTDEK